jgi:asparaginyl-tRNA synthetase
MVSPRIIDLLRSGQTSDSYIVRGWVRTKREGKGISFLERFVATGTTNRFTTDS